MKHTIIKYSFYAARVAELEDALDLGSSLPMRIGVRVPSLAPILGGLLANMFEKEN